MVDGAVVAFGAEGFAMRKVVRYERGAELAGSFAVLVRLMKFGQQQGYLLCDWRWVSTVVIWDG